MACRFNLTISDITYPYNEDTRSGFCHRQGCFVVSMLITAFLDGRHKALDITRFKHHIGTQLTDKDAEAHRLFIRIHLKGALLGLALRYCPFHEITDTYAKIDVVLDY